MAIWIYLLVVTIAFIVADIVIGRVFKFYEKTMWFDIVMHFICGAFILAVAGFWIAGTLGLPTNLSKSIFAFLFAATMTALWELFEFAVDSIFDTNLQRWKDSYTAFKRGGLIDSMTDLLATIIGAGVACSFLWLII